MRLGRQRVVRKGVSLIEAAVILSVFMTLVLGTLDLGLAVYRYNIVSEAARQGARQAIVHGQLAAPQMPTWGPATINTTASAGVPLAQAIHPFLVGIDPNTTTIHAEWPQNNTRPDSQVRVAVSVPYKPIMTFIFGNPTFTLTASSTMRICH
jgi:Flp pilus assembly protein TadG